MIARTVLFLCVWLVLAGTTVSDIVAGLIAAPIATWISFRLWPSGSMRLAPAALVMMALRFLRQSVVAGIDVGSRALDPHPRLLPGFADIPTALPEGAPRAAFCTLTSLLPGSLPIGSSISGRAIRVHVLDARWPVRETLETEENRFVRAFGIQRADG